ncbi:MAG: hypothetical protein KAS32_07235 [Candidatus Peribacteraceae bacterium]|nr:hypothetical protein [Candidatus Peribacteraceae bacterium]
MLNKIMEDFGYTFEDMSRMTRRQRSFLFAAKAARMKEEAKILEKSREESKKNEKRGGRASGRGTIGNRRPRGRK